MPRVRKARKVLPAKRERRAKRGIKVKRAIKAILGRETRVTGETKAKRAIRVTQCESCSLTVK